MLEMCRGDAVVDGLGAECSQAADHLVVFHAGYIVAATEAMRGGARGCWSADRAVEAPIEVASVDPHPFRCWDDVHGMQHHRPTHHNARTFKRVGSIVGIGLLAAGLVGLPSITDAGTTETATATATAMAMAMGLPPATATEAALSPRS